MKSFTLIFLALAVACLSGASCTSVAHKRIGHVGAVGGQGIVIDKQEGVTVAWNNEKSFQDVTAVAKTYLWTELGGTFLTTLGNFGAKYLAADAAKATATEATKRAALSEATKQAALETQTPVLP